MGTITSRVDIIWTNGNNTQVRRVNDVTTNSTSVYNDLFIIPSLDISNNGSVYHCEASINSSSPTRARSNITIFIPGMYTCNICSCVVKFTVIM